MKGSDGAAELFHQGLKKRKIIFAKKVAQIENLFTFARAFEEEAKRDREVHCNK